MDIQPEIMADAKLMTITCALSTIDFAHPIQAADS